MGGEKNAYSVDLHTKHPDAKAVLGDIHIISNYALPAFKLYYGGWVAWGTC